MVEPSGELQMVFDKAIDVAKKLNHEYITLEHLCFAMLCEESFNKCVSGFGADTDYIRKNLEHYLKNKLTEIVIPEGVTKPKKTQAVERALNRAFTQVLFNGRQKIECTDVFLAIMSEKKSFAFYYIQQANIDKDKFRINTELIPNKLTKKYIDESKKLEYCFKVILGSFNKKRKKPIGIFTENTLNIFNNFVDFIQKKIDEYFNKKSEIELTRSGLVDFGEFFDIKYDVDAEDQVYPDVYTEIEQGREKEKKKGKFPTKVEPGELK